jgi:hypothetical protein
MFSKKISEFFDKSLVINCPRMTITQLASNSPEVYQGSGSITRTSSGQLELKLFHSGDVSLSSFFRKVPEGYGAVGKPVPENRYFNLDATDNQGREWRSERFSIDKRFSIDEKFQGNEVTITAQLYKISHTAQVLSNENASLRLQLSEIIDIPFYYVMQTGERAKPLINFAYFQACGYEFIIKHESNGTLIEVTSNSSDLPNFIETRVCEALQFVVGVLISWSIFELNQSDKKTIVVQALLNKGNGDIQREKLPPIRLYGRDTDKDIWNLFEKYLYHIINYPKKDFHPVSGWVRRVIDARTPIVETRMLVFPVAVEGLLDINPLKENLINTVDDSIKSEALRFEEEIKDKLKLEESFDPNFVGRLNGWLKDVKNVNDVRAIDKLYNLKKKGLLDERLIDSWKKVRNKSVHGNTIKPNEVKKYSRFCYQVSVLFNHLIFLIIGYTGKYTDYADYSEEGWIEKEFNGLIDKSN